MFSLFAQVAAHVSATASATAAAPTATASATAQAAAEAAAQGPAWYEELLRSGALGYMIAGGIFMWPILLLGILAFGVIIERYLLRLGRLADVPPDEIIELLRPCFRTLAATPAPPPATRPPTEG